MINAMAVNHIGIAVRSIADQRDFYERILGGRFEGEEVVEDQKVRVAFFAIGDAENPVRLELLEPTTDDSPVASFIEKRGEGVHHIAYTVSDIDERIRELRESGVRMIDESARQGAHNAQIAFIHPSDTGRVLTELCEPQDPLS
jgi:methylmalonyl-CoA/ethylmalonyl-CoA epimerase